MSACLVATSFCEEGAVSIAAIALTRAFWASTARFGQVIGDSEKGDVVQEGQVREVKTETPIDPVLVTVLIELFRLGQRFTLAAV